MFDVGFWELLLIGIVTLLVVGPDRLPEVARTAGRWVAKTRRFVAGVRADFNRELETGELHKLLGDQKKELNELRSLVNSTRKEIEGSTSDALKAAQSGLASLEASAEKLEQDDGSAPEAEALLDEALDDVALTDEALADEANLVDVIPTEPPPSSDADISNNTPSNSSGSSASTDSAS